MKTGIQKIKKKSWIPASAGMTTFQKGIQLNHFSKGKLIRVKKGKTKAENRIFLIIPLIISLVLLPLAAYGQEETTSPYSSPAPDQMNASTPPVEQSLVPEGFFAVQLAQALKLGRVQDEAQAESMLSAIGIEPKNGWIAGYPLTPDIVAEIEKSVAAAAEAKKLEMGKEEAQKAVKDLAAKFGLNIQPGVPQAAAGGTQPASPPAEVVNNYYYDYGPPVVTYYAPPWPYDYLYAWVPFPFWSGGFFFSGFFILHDFHRHIHFHHHAFVVSNHVFNRSTNKVFVVDPVHRTRTFGGERMTNRFTSPHVFGSSTVQSRARTIVARSQNRIVPGGVSTSPRMGNVAPSESLSRPQGQIRPNQGRLNGQREVRPGNNFAPPRISEGRTFSPPVVSGRSFAPAPRGRSFSPPSASQGRIFSMPSTGGRSFGGFHGGGFSSHGGFSGGGFGGRR